MMVVCCGLSATKHVSHTVRPVSTPPPTRIPEASRASTEAETKWETRVDPLPAGSSVLEFFHTRLDWPNFLGETSYRPHTCWPPPPGSAGSTGVVIQYGLKSVGVTASFTSARMLPSQL